MLQGDACLVAMASFPPGWKLAFKRPLRPFSPK
jgi:hypothetical protein